MNSVSCVVCKGSTQCFRCEITKLKNENRELRNELTKYYLLDNESFYLSYNEKLMINQTYIQSSTPQPYEYKNRLSNEHFITITFDPVRFGLQAYEQERKDYILAQLAVCFRKGYFTDLYGCFEYHKNGLVHSHLIVNTPIIKDLAHELKKKFTFNMYNKICIDFGPAKYPQAKQYLEKESTHYYILRPPKKFKLKNHQLGPDDNLYEVDSDTDSSDEEPEANPLDI